ncbi:hypothetical protein [Ramlibacter humi]|uniref:ATP-grasp domain-containing protein n=1 Tax=Ramlibacter humi TaxID=2530451 RepID=A0A4Z0BCR7_9BURK|nr:hypothetical protein [Ramlibacter humi]TFY97066.1 hypothetical protein EZ216_19590 [Ramlibacter humi]
MAYINAFLTHFRAVQEWGRSTQASIELDVMNFEMEVKCRGRYYHLFPQFVGAINGRFFNMPALTPDTGGFIGWLPYRLVKYELARDKLYFKTFVREAGLLTPASWDLAAESPSPNRDYILKRSMGSFGYELAGPFRAGTAPPKGRLATGNGTVFAEQFIRGRSLKVWYWGQRAFFAHLREPSEVLADGSSTVHALVDQRLKSGHNADLETYKERHVVQDCLAFQDLALADVPKKGTSVLVDYRYGREYRPAASSLQSDNEMALIPAPAMQAIEAAGSRFAAKLLENMPAPVAYSLDGVIDEEGQVWWLEANSNPAFPPEGYAAMFGDLFGG